MANQEHLDILKQGVRAWNVWRKQYPQVSPDLSNANFSGAKLRRVNLSNINLRKADFFEADLSKANFGGADLSGADLSFARIPDADFFGTNLSGANCFAAYLSGSDFRKANLFDADLRGTYLTCVDLREALLGSADLSGASLSFANFRKTVIEHTVFGEVDLSEAEGLDAVEHRGPSIIGIDSIYLSKGNIPEIFLKGAGVPDSFIEYMHSLIGRPIDYYTCFISYSSHDQGFAEQLYADLQNKGVRCWYAPEDLKIGDHYHQRIDESIRLYDKLILILSEHALASAWVEREVVAAREKEDRSGRLVLFPVRLDESVLETKKAWAADVRRRWHIGDFTRWKDHDCYQEAFNRLLRDLKAETK